MKEKEIFIFDLDRTLTVSAEFSDFVGVLEGETVNTNEYFPEHFKKIKSLFYDLLMKEVIFIKNGKHIIVVNAKNKSTFDGMQLSDMISKNKDVNKYLTLFSDIITVKHPAGFYADPNTLGYAVNDKIFKEYKSASHKMILTGRGEKLREHILKMLKFLHMQEPNEGLMLWPGNPNIMEWKSKVIIETASTGKWDMIHFYEDRADWLDYAKKSMEINYPNIEFVAHHIVNTE